ncbi:MAG: hypothetical protein ACPG8W_21150 [Candidatus Promineifilaceae bacterium]
MNFARSSYASAEGTAITIINANDGGISFDYLYDGQNVTLADGESYTRQPFFADNNQNIFQTLEVGYTLTVECVDSSGAVVEDNLVDGNNLVTVFLPDGEHITCTFTNTDTSSSFTVLTSSDTDETFTYSYSRETDDILQADGEQFSRSQLGPGNYDVFQTVPAGYVLDMTCTGAATPATVFGNGVRIILGVSEDVVCMFDNDYVGSNITLNNAINGGDATEIVFADVSFSNMPADNGGTGFILADGEAIVVEDKLPGQSTIFASIPEGYAADLGCTGSVSNTIGTNSIQLNLMPEETITCNSTFNYVAGSVTINNVATPVSDEPFSYATSFGNLEINSNENFVDAIVMPGNEVFIFQTQKEGYDLSISCNGANVTTSGNGAFITLENNEDVVCDFVNTDENASGGGENLLTNGDFELGRDGSWREQSTWGFDLVVHESAYGGTVPPQSGEHLAWLGGARWEKSYISQEVTLPEGENAVVNFSYWIESRDWCGYDWGVVYIFDGSNFYRVWSQTLCRGSETDGWADAEIDISSFAGQTVRVLFNARNDGWYRSSMYVDDVSVMTVAGGRSASSGEEPKNVGSGDAEEVMNNDVEAITESVVKPERDENNRDYQDDIISAKAVSGTTAVALSSANAESTGSSVAIIATLLSTIVGATAVVVSNRRREM